MKFFKYTYSEDINFSSIQTSDNVSCQEDYIFIYEEKHSEKFANKFEDEEGEKEEGYVEEGHKQLQKQICIY